MGKTLLLSAELHKPFAKFQRFNSGLESLLDMPKESVSVIQRKLCIQPSSIKESVQKHSSSCSCTRRHLPNLIPRLPDDLVMACLIRVPRMEHRKLRLVCKAWNKLLVEDDFFYTLREKLGFVEEWIYVIKRKRKDSSMTFHAFDPINRLWLPLPPLPKECKEYTHQNINCQVLNGGDLYLCGFQYECSRGHVIFYSVRTNKWHRAPDMLQPRIRFRSCVINNRLYVAGGGLVERRKLVHLKSAEVYDPIKNKWSFVADMTRCLELVDGYVHNGMWFVKGLLGKCIVHQVYDPVTDEWFKIDDDMVAPRRIYPKISIDGNLYTSSCEDGCKLDLYDAATDSWVPSNIDCSRKKILPLNNGKLICIIRDDMSISVVDVSKVQYDDYGRRQFEAYHLWEVKKTFELEWEQFCLSCYNYLTETENYFIPHSQILRA
ncbi:hypothetical protein MKW92_016618 [Papaver armeniacum]|nr:hypothetical protein MKW92_016618 [Papaver armeniacum]